MLQSATARRYRIRGLLGRGGFGAVYRATLLGDHGFERDVAIKLLLPEVADAITLARFRDEARILGLVRDRAVVAVDPPTRLEGRWAMVMEYVDGVSLSRLLVRDGPLPPRVAAEIVEEIARVLHAVYRQPGPDGNPLALLHRDLKPANLQITPSGAVKVLDFGIAKARFDAREAETTQHVVGTYKYMAPERLLNQEGPAADVYSLGVVLRRTAFGHEPLSPGIIDGEPPIGGPEALLDLAALGERMTSVDPTLRPSAREVEVTCRFLADQLPGQRLREWAEANVPHDLPLREDELTGSWLTEVVETERAGRPMEPVARRRIPLAAAFVAGLGMIVAGTLGIGAAVLVVAVLPNPPRTNAIAPTDPPVATDPLAVPDPTVPDPTVPEPGPAIPEPEPQVPEPASPIPAPMPPEPPGPAAPVPRPVAPTPVLALDPPVPDPVAQEPADAQTFPVTFGSNPAGAEVWLDGQNIGRTPLLGILLTEGEHTVTLKHRDREMLRTITVGKRRPTRYIWSGEDWQSFL